MKRDVPTCRRARKTGKKAEEEEETKTSKEHSHGTGPVLLRPERIDLACITK